MKGSTGACEASTGIWKSAPGSSTPEIFPSEMFATVDPEATFPSIKKTHLLLLAIAPACMPPEMAQDITPVRFAAEATAW